jgi:outer membrane protein OmpA-like peptidoglycan-associated protein
VNIRIEFAFDSAALDDAQKPKLQKLCNVMQSSDINLFRIIGHTDASGTADYNERLSRLRAEEVQRFFVNDCGIDPGRLEAVGLGKRFLLDNVDPRSEQNRRVEFQALS